MAEPRLTKVYINAATPVEIEPGVTIRPGRYPATKQELAVPSFGGRTVWTDPEYLVELAEAQIITGSASNPAFVSTEYNVTKLVHEGQLTLMSFVKHCGHDWNVLHARQREVD